MMWMAEIVVPCQPSKSLISDFRGGDFAVSIFLGMPAGYQVEVDIGARLGTFTGRRGFMAYGANLLVFAEQLQAMHQNLKGTAKLCDWDNRAVLRLAVLSDATGAISVGGDLGIGSSNDCHWPKPFRRHEGISFAFEGLTIDQSFLPAITGDLHRFLTEWEVDTIHPDSLHWQPR